MKIENNQTTIVTTYNSNGEVTINIIPVLDDSIIYLPNLGLFY